MEESPTTKSTPTALLFLALHFRSISPRLLALAMAPSVKEILLTHSRHIRDVLAPVVAREGGRLNDPQTASLNAIFASLSTVKITVEMLRYSRMDRALTVISMEGSAWQGPYQLLAEALLANWEQSLGPLRNIKADLWGPGGRLEGIKKVQSKDDDRDAKSVSARACFGDLC